MTASAITNRFIRADCTRDGSAHPPFGIRIPGSAFRIHSAFRIPQCIVWPVPVHIVDHPLVHDALVRLRDKDTAPEYFRQAATRISVLLASEALRDMPTEDLTVETPLGPAPGRRVGRDVVVVPVLRAGLGMLDAVLELVPSARVGHIGLQRDEMTAVASQYYSKLPARLDHSYVLMIDPMLATGGSAVAALELLRKVGARDVRMICIVAAPEGVALVERHHPDVQVFTPVVDSGLNAHKFIVPGLGDFGDRLYGTE
jgi:uracil phosphoribosyltransferase